MRDYEIKRVKEHYELYIDGVFYCSADTFMEAAEELEKLREKEN